MKYKINNLEQYQEQYQEAISKPKEFWNKIAKEFSWSQKWIEVCEFDMINAEFSWFKNAKTNITENCIDRHLKDKGAQTALIFEPNAPNDIAEHISYHELHKRVCKMANALIALDVKKGDRVAIY